MLSRMVNNALTRQKAPDKSNTSIATSAMNTSAKAIQMVGQSGVKNAGKMAAVVPLLTGKELKQEQAHTMGKRLGEVKRDAVAMKALKPIVVEAAKAWESAEKDRAEMAKALSGSAQRIAIANSKAQVEMFHGHLTATTQVAYHQAAYGGFSV